MIIYLYIDNKVFRDYMFRKLFGKKEEGHSVSDEHIDGIKVGVLASDLSYSADQDDDAFALKIAEINVELVKSGNQMVREPIPFFKKNGEHAGYVIETEHEIIVAYHGTQIDKFFNDKKNSLTTAIRKDLTSKAESLFGEGATEVINDLSIRPTGMSFGMGSPKVHAGFKAEYRDSQDALYDIINGIDKDNKPLVFTGHSLGGAVAQIAALDAASNRGSKVHDEKLKTDKDGNPIQRKDGQFEMIKEKFGGRTVSGVYTYGAPRVFTPSAAKIYDKFGLSDKTYRVCHPWDWVPKIPPYPLYEHAGHEVKISEKMRHPLGGHDLSEAYKNVVNNFVNKVSNLASEVDSKIKQTEQKTRSWYSTIESYTSYVMNATRDMFRSNSRFESKGSHHGRG